MKFFQSQIDQLLKQIASNKIRALLLYGPDKGYISKICALITEKFGLIRSSIDYSNVNSQNLEILLNSRNFFGKKELIKIASVTNKMDKNLSLVLKQEFINFPIFIADELPATSSIRKLFENESNLASTGCYHDNNDTIVGIILTKIGKKSIQNEALQYLKAHLQVDHLLLGAELDKLLHFIGNQTQITLDDVRTVIAKDLVQGNADKLCIYFATKDVDKFLSELTKLQEQEVNSVLIIKALIRYYLNLYLVVSQMERGVSLDTALRVITPAIFFKYLPGFKGICSNITIKDILKTLAILNQAELDLKLRPDSFDFYQQVYAQAQNSE